MRTAEQITATAAKQMAYLDATAKGLGVSQAAEAAGISRRTPSVWTNDPDFAAKLAEAKAEAAQNTGPAAINAEQVSEWTAEQDSIAVEILGLEAKILTHAAPALAGSTADKSAIASLTAERDTLNSRAATLAQAIESAQQHIEKARLQAEAEAREAAATDADRHLATQRAAAARVDAALIELGIGWREFQAASALRQSATRRSGGRSRGAYSTSLINAAFKLCLTAADDMGLDRRVKTPGCRSLTDLLN